jgi:cobalt-zinc-cadmium efflux system membrane fusion protein
VTSRDVVPGNYYDKASVLLTITPLDHLWVLVSVPEIEMDKMHVGQRMEVQFPFLQQRIQSLIQYISSDIEASTRTMKLRTGIPNPDGRLRSGMRVRALVDVPPVRGYTVVNKLALVESRGDYAVFIKRPGKTARYERRRVQPASIHQDFVVVARGLTPGEEIVANPPLLNPRDRRLRERELYLRSLLQEIRDRRDADANRR